MEEFAVSFDADLSEMIGRGRGLMAVWRNVHRGRLPWHGRHRHPFCEECWWPWSPGFADLHMLLNDDASWAGRPLLRPLFKAFVYAEHRFSSRFCPLGSHEERLTGHLVSEISSALTVVEPFIQQRGRDLYGQEVELDFVYEDLAAGGRETYTGADFGIVLFVNLPGMIEPHVRWAVFQAKKVQAGKSTARIEVKQLVDLINWSQDRTEPDAALYCFYDTDAARGLAPVVANALSVKNAVEAGGNEVPDSYTAEEADALGKRRPPIDIIETARCSLSEYLVFSMAVFGEGRPARGLWEAMSILRRVPEGRDAPPVRRVLVVALGSTRQQDIGDLRDLLRE